LDKDNDKGRQSPSRRDQKKVSRYKLNKDHDSHVQNSSNSTGNLSKGDSVSLFFVDFFIIFFVDFFIISIDSFSS
jgi:hypothetical protein